MKLNLDVIDHSSGLFCNLEFVNGGDESYFVNKIDAGLSGGIKSKLFVIQTEDRLVPYIGKLMKRRVAEAKDFVELPPGDSLKSSIRIDEAYDFLPGEHRYAIKYKYYHSSPEEDPQLNLIESNIVYFTYAK